MTDEKIRMRCLELAYSEENFSCYEVAEEMYRWVIKTRLIQNQRENIRNTVVYEKQMERKD